MDLSERQAKQSYGTAAASQKAGGERPLDCSRYMVERGRKTRSETHALSAAFLKQCKAGCLIVIARRKK